MISAEPPARADRALFAFAWYPSFDDALEEVAALAETEDWSYQATPTDRPHPILYHYLHHTFARLEAEGDVGFAEGNAAACFDTGLVTPLQEPIYAYFTPNRREDRQPWFGAGFRRRGEYDLTRFPTLPPPASWFDDPAELVFDARLEIRPNLEHIVGDNRGRFPEPYRSMGDYQLQTLVRGAIENARRRAARSYKVAIPHFYRGAIHLLLPLCLEAPDRCDLALAITRHETFYRAATCFTLDQAYNNARLIAPPDRAWLVP